MIFQKEYIDLILSKEKECTIRKGDVTKRLKVGHIYKCRNNRYKKDFFAKIKIESIKIKEFDEVTEEDAKKDLFKNLEECKAKLIQLNGEEIKEGKVSIIHFKLASENLGNKKVEIKYIKIKDLKLSEYNPRVMDEKNLKNLKESLRMHGWLSPLVINIHQGRKNILISGHQRIKVAKELGMTEVPIIEVDLDPVREKALNLALNKIGGEFEEEKLIDVLSQINEENEDILTTTGFDTTEINYLLGLREQEKERIFAKSNEDPFDLNNKHGIKIGDIVKLDDHLIICGDSTEPDNLKKIVGNKKIDLVVTSPPYNLDIKYGKYTDNKELKEYLYMIEKVFLNIRDFMEKGSFLCINIGREWGPVNMPAKYDNLMESLEYTFFRNIYWSKPKGAARGTVTTRNPFPRYYIPKVQTEIIQIYAADNQPKIYDQMITYKIGEGKREKTEKIPKMLLEKYSGNVWEMMTETTLGQDHPAPFPVQLPFNCIRFFSFEKEIVLDPFLGSGSTLIAADQLNRRCYGIELDPSYVSLAIERFLMYKPNAKLEIMRGLDPKEKIV